MLDILAPNKSISERLPVIMWIHGGGCTLLDAQAYSRDAIVNASIESVVYASLRYRLGLDGTR